jgi:GH24 family phage-related lysozyme (muramidase)
MTVGIGHLLSHWEMPTFVDPANGEPRKTLSEAECDELLTQDIADAEHDLTRVLPRWRDLDDVRQRACLNLSFNLGNRLAQFTRFLDAMGDDHWLLAASELKHSVWFHQVGNRGERIAAMIRDGYAQGDRQE